MGNANKSESDSIERLYDEFLDDNIIGLELNTIRSTLEYWKTDTFREDDPGLISAVDDLRHIAKRLGV